MLSINTNITAMNALRNYAVVSEDVSRTIERLSTGLRINRAADDPAGLIISENLRSQIDGLQQAVANAQEASSLIRTAEGAMSEVSNLIHSIRSLAVQAANTGVNDTTAVQAAQTQIEAAINSIQRIAGQTQYGSRFLLDGSSGTTASVVNTTLVAGASLQGTFAGAPLQPGTVQITVNNAATRAQYNGSGVATYASINASLSTVNGLNNGNGGTVVINGQSIQVSGSDTVQSLLNRINNIAGATGVSALFTSGNGSGAILLTQQNYGANFRIDLSESATILGVGVPGTHLNGLNATVTVTANVRINGAVQTTTSTFSGGQGTDTSGLRVSDNYNNSILLTEAGNSTGVVNANVVTVSGGSLRFQVGANDGQLGEIALGGLRPELLGLTSVPGKALATINVSTYQGAEDAIRIADEALGEVSRSRAVVGAFQRFTLDSTIRSLNNNIENLMSAESRIRDADVASEVVKLTKQQIIQQAGVSVLARANQAPQLLLSLLR